MRTEEEMKEMKQRLDKLKTDIETLLNTKKEELEKIMPIAELVAFGNWIMGVMQHLAAIGAVMVWLEGELIEMKPGETDLPGFITHVESKLDEIVSKIPIEGKILNPVNKLILPN